MPIIKKKKYGKIIIEEGVIGEMILEALELHDTKGRIFASTQKGKILSGGRPNCDDVGTQLNISFSGEILKIEIPTVMRFGYSISKVTRNISDYIVGELNSIGAFSKIHIVIKVTGVISKQFAKRDLSVEYKYGF